jgi:cell pole-organizing protein PopZ
MTEPKAQGQEPTMEEILASIRRIISENDDPNAAAPASAAKPAAASAAPRPADDGVLELTDMVGADGKVVDLSAKGAASVSIPEPPARDEVPLMSNTPSKPPATPSAPEIADDVELSPVEVAQQGSKDSEDSLVTAGTAAASAAALAAFAQQMNRKSDDTGQPAGSLPIGSGRTLEDLVKEMLRPMLREWLDANLPSMVERLVKREIERIGRRAED